MIPPTLIDAAKRGADALERIGTGLLRLAAAVENDAARAGSDDGKPFEEALTAQRPPLRLLGQAIEPICTGAHVECVIDPAHAGRMIVRNMQ